MNRIFTLIFRFCEPFFSCFSHVVVQVRLDLHNGVMFSVHMFGQNMLSGNNQINTHCRINATYPINAPPRCKLCIIRSPLINAPRLIDTRPRIASKPKETLHRVKPRNLFRFSSCLINTDLRIASCSISSTVGHLRALPEQSRGIGARHRFRTVNGISGLCINADYINLLLTNSVFYLTPRAN